MAHLKGYIGTVVSTCLLLYTLSFLLLFDVTTPAIIDRQERLGHPVAYGPKYRYGPYSKEQIFYRGAEWPYYVYAPFCSVWRFAYGYEYPTEEVKN